MMVCMVNSKVGRVIDSWCVHVKPCVQSLLKQDSEEEEEG